MVALASRMTSWNNKEEAMYKELFLNSVSKTLSGDIVLTDVMTVGRGGFQYNQSITSLELPNATKLSGDNCFSSCINCTRFSIPKVTGTIPKSCFSYCNNLVEVHCESASGFDVQCFLSSTKLERIYADNLTTLSSTWCNGNTLLTDIYVRNRTTEQVLSISEFPGFVNMSAETVYPNITWHCSDGNIVWNGESWVVAAS